jgi:micrococcal nuclease
MQFFGARCGLNNYLWRCSLGVCLALVGWAVQADTLTAVVTYVTDGDTLWVQLPGESRAVKLRFQGIDAPELCQDGGAASKAALAAKVLHHTVQLTTNQRRDDYGRLLARVSLGTDAKAEDVGAWMVQQGQAWSYRYRRSLGPYADQEQAAQAAKRGLWAMPAPMEPRVFRKQHGSCYAPAP